MDKYTDLVRTQPSFKVVDNASELRIKTVSCMCDNEHNLLLKKDNRGNFMLNGCGNAFSNWQMKHQPYEIEWAADKGDWAKVIQMINTGTSRVSEVVSR